MDGFNIDDFKLLLKQMGFSDQDIENNWKKYLEAVLVVTIDEYLKQVPEVDRNQIVGEDNIENPDEAKRIMTRFLDYYQSHKADFHPKLNQSDIFSKIKSYN